MSSLLFLLLLAHPLSVLGPRLFEIVRLTSGNNEFYRKHSFTFKTTESRLSLSLSLLLMHEQESTTVFPQINDWTYLNQQLDFLESLTLLPLNLGGFHCPLLDYSNDHPSPQPAEAQNCSEESAHLESPGLFGVYGPSALGDHCCVGYGPFPFCVAP